MHLVDCKVERPQNSDPSADLPTEAEDPGQIVSGFEYNVNGYSALGVRFARK